MNNELLQTLLTAFIAGDREGAQAAASQALDQCVHDFIFPNEAGADGGDLSGDVEDAFIPDEDSMGDDLGSDDMAPAMGDEMPMGDEMTMGADLPVPQDEDELEFAAVESATPAGDPLDEGLGDLPRDDEDGMDVVLPDEGGDDAAMGALGDEVGIPASDVSGIEEVPGDGEAVAAPNVVDVAVDPEQGDEVVSAVKLMFDDETDFTFFTFAQDAEKVVDAIKNLTSADVEGGDPAMSTDELTAQLGENFRLL